MPAKIEVKKLGENRYRISVTEGSGQTSHRVTVQPPYLEKLAVNASAVEELVRRSFEFLLEHEPKESVLAEFDLAVIQRYFPDYEQEIRRRLAG